MTAAEALADWEPVIAAEAILRGHVQGLGVRPAIANLAARCRLRGSVSNIASGVAITIEGAFEDIVKFRNDLQGALPAEAVLEECLWSEGVSRGLTSFAILQLPSRSELTTPIPRDRAVCRECLRDTFDSHSRRRDYPFTSCTKCGPRFSIIESMPYERATTSMRSFRLCSLCTAEYQDPDDRRFHAQTNACAHCGPRLWSRDREGQAVDDSTDALSCAAAEIRRGGIIALLGVGGYQLLCDATNDHAVRRLRVAKRRPEKPFAVMLDGVLAAGLQARSSLTEWAALSGAENPIVIRSTPSEMGLCSGIAPGLSCSGLLLPTTPLHALLAGKCNVPLVVTSGNVDGDPLAVAPEEAERSLADIADLFLHHDRPIAHPVDDSVVRVIADRPVTIRLARGLAPLPLPIPAPPPGLALGGQQKVAIALSNGSQAVLGPHLGDLDSLAMRRRFEAHVEEMLDLYDCRPRFVAIDHHPDYFTSRWVQQLGVPGVDVDESGLRRELIADRLSDADSRAEPRRCFSDLQQIVRVQHHHAHIAAGMLECGWQNREVLGVAFDGTGSGTDGTIWGGEFLLCTLKS
ncbi:MAG TPA: carbamoyltransferase HypF, partial [Caulifigura sp.]|nr:carbamoyltransferase HypF [Caulifigura sp.]